MYIHIYRYMYTYIYIYIYIYTHTHMHGCNWHKKRNDCLRNSLPVYLGHTIYEIRISSFYPKKIKKGDIVHTQNDTLRNSFSVYLEIGHVIPRKREKKKIPHLRADTVVGNARDFQSGLWHFANVQSWSTDGHDPEPLVLQPVPWKMRLRMLVGILIEILNDGGDFSQLVEIEKLKFLCISRYKFKLRFWLNLNSSVSPGTNSNRDFEFAVDSNLLTIQDFD